MNHSLISASGNTHAKIAGLAIMASLVFMAMVSASGVTRTDSAPAHGPIVKATTTTMMATSGAAAVR
jgi:hypothetical protein